MVACVIPGEWWLLSVESVVCVILENVVCVIIGECYLGPSNFNTFSIHHPQKKRGKQLLSFKVVGVLIGTGMVRGRT